MLLNKSTEELLYDFIVDNVKEEEVKYILAKTEGLNMESLVYGFIVVKPFLVSDFSKDLNLIHRIEHMTFSVENGFIERDYTIMDRSIAESISLLDKTKRSYIAIIIDDGNKKYIVDYKSLKVYS